MEKKSKWNPKVKIEFVEVSDVRFEQILAEIARIIYLDMSDCQSHDTNSTAASPYIHDTDERKVA